MNNTVNHETLMYVLSKMFGKTIISATHQSEQLQGGTLGDVQLISGIAETAGSEKLPYKVVWKRQKKWERPCDQCSWSRE